MLKTKFFKPEDFQIRIEFVDMYPSAVVIYHMLEEYKIKLAEQANLKLSSEIEKWPVVYSWQGYPGVTPLTNEWTTMEGCPDTTHQARLAFIEPIEKKECEHHPEAMDLHITSTNQIIINKIKCKHCGIELEAKWVVKNAD